MFPNQDRVHQLLSSLLSLIELFFVYLFIFTEESFQQLTRYMAEASKPRALSPLEALSPTQQRWDMLGLYELKVTNVIGCGQTLIVSWNVWE